jgi:2-deoxy-D-gluconate 3-dehydrogenase
MSDPFRLDGKVALVTGANTGIGQAIAIGLARAGAEVVAAEGLKGRPFQLALDEPAAAAQSLSTVGPLDILVNNAGIIRRADAVDFSEADWDDVIDVNLKAVFFLSQAFARTTFARGTGGRSSTSPRCSPSRAASASRPTPRPNTASPG